MIDKTNKENIKKLIKNINFDNVNIDIIKKNAKYLYNEAQKIKKIFNTLNNKYNIDQTNNDKELEFIYNLVSTSQLMNYKEFEKYIINNNTAIKYNIPDNIKFYVIKKKLDKYDEEKINNLIKITLSLKKYFNNNDNTSIIWIPINKERNFYDNNITFDKLKESRDNYEAFTASGLTFGEKERFTIITRYEEIEKLLIHELAHNFGIDGSLSHKHDFKCIKKKYTEEKNKLSNNNNKNYDYMFSIYESYAELSSSYFNLIFLNINKENMYDKLVTGILIELLYSYNTICNLAKLNGYKNYNEFINKKTFIGEICFFEYYYLKGLMYNNYIFKVIENKDSDPKILYNDVIPLIDKNDILLEKIYDINTTNQTNFKFCYFYIKYNSLL
jgi:hypothetical protein